MIDIPKEYHPYVTYSTLSPLFLEPLIQEQYRLGDVTCNLLIRGVHDTYTVTTGNLRYALRIYRSGFRTREEIAAECELLTVLSARRLPVSAPIPTAAGDHMVLIHVPEGLRYAVLFSWAEGKTPGTMDKERLTTFGSLIAHFHHVSAGIRLSHPRWKITTESTLWNPLMQIVPYYNDHPLLYKQLADVACAVDSALQQIDTKSLRSGYCHFDLFPKNIHFSGESATLFDFDFLGYGWLIYDLAGFLSSLLFDEQLGRISAEKCDRDFETFLAAYQEVRPLSPEERAVIPLLVPSFWLYYLGFYTTHDQFLPLLHHPHLTGRTELLLRMCSRAGVVAQ